MSTNNVSVASALSRASTVSTKEEAVRVKAELQKHQTNLNGAVSWLCPTGASKQGQELARTELPKIAKAINDINVKFKLGSSYKAPIAAVATLAALAGAYKFDLLSKATSYLPSVSLPSISMPAMPSIGVPTFVSTIGGTVKNATLAFGGNVAATAKAVDSIWGVSSLVPSAATLTTIGYAGLAVGGALAVAYIAHKAYQHCHKPKIA
jgi:hypothetical protein